MTPAPYAASTALHARIKRKLVQAVPAGARNARFARGTLSVTFDDAPHSAIVHGASQLEARGLLGAFYVCAGFTNGVTHFGPMHTTDDIARLMAAGHEIACHTFSHKDSARQPARTTLADIDANAAAFAALGAPAFSAFAYPYGETHFALKSALAKKFLTARGIAPGLNIGQLDCGQLRANALYGEDTWARTEALLLRAQAENGWAILFTHDVQDVPTPWGCTPALLARALDFALELGLDILPVTQAFQRGVGP